MPGLRYRQWVCLVLLTLCMSKAGAFVRISRNFAFDRSLVPGVECRTLHFATVYAPSWESWDDEICGLDEEEPNTSRTLAECLSMEQMAALARLAVAFSPAGRALQLKNIEHVEVLSVDGSHIEIEAVVCESDGCVTLAVPVEFPSPCRANDAMEECVMDNLGQLDLQAGEKLRQTEWNASHEEENQKLWMELTSSRHLEFPSWWVAPKLIPNMAEECDNVRHLLNQEGFQSEVKALAMQGLSTLTGGDSFVVEQAAIAAVCPTGVYMRARAKHVGLFEEDTIALMEVPLAFGDQAMDASSLRAAVINAVAAASSYAD